MRICGIDPGSRITGYGCVDLPDGAVEPALVEAGVVRLKPTAPLPERLGQLFEDLDAVFGDLRPDVVVVEQLFAHYRHARTSIVMGHARGVVILAAQRRGMRIEEMTATEIKRAVTGHGHATKQQMQLAVMAQCGLDAIPEPPDVADAIAIGLCAARRHLSRDALSA